MTDSYYTYVRTPVDTPEEVVNHLNQLQDYALEGFVVIDTQIVVMQVGDTQSMIQSTLLSNLPVYKK